MDTLKHSKVSETRISCLFNGRQMRWAANEVGGKKCLLLWVAKEFGGKNKKTWGSWENLEAPGKTILP